MTPLNIKRHVAERGWSFANLAFRWGITPRHLVRVLGASPVEQKWLDALAGLPRLTRTEAKALKSSRIRLAQRSKSASTSESQPTHLQQHRPPIASAVAFEAFGFLREGSVLVALGDYGEIGEGDEVVVTERRALPTGDAMYLVKILATGEECWFASEAALFDVLVETGRELQL